MKTRNAMRSPGPAAVCALAGVLGGCSIFESAKTVAVQDSSRNHVAQPPQGPEEIDPAGPGVVTARPGVIAATPGDASASAIGASAGGITEFDSWADARDELERDLRFSSAPSVMSQMTPMRSPNVTQVTFAHTGEVFDPDVTRDGRTIVYASTQHSVTSDLYVKSMGARVQTQLTRDPANDAMPAVSPDGSRIAFCSDRGGSWDIYIMPIAGGRPMVVSSSTAHEIHPSWSPDGSKIVFNRRGSVSGRWEMWVVDADDATTAQFIGYGLFPEFCPRTGVGLAGGDRILFQQGRERGSRAFSVWTLDYDGNNATALTEIVSAADTALINPTWSPDGKWILFASVPADDEWSLLAKVPPREASLWMIDVDGTDLVRLTSGDAIDLMPTWASPNRVLFASNRDGGENLWAMDLEDALVTASVGDLDTTYAGAEAQED